MNQFLSDPSFGGHTVLDKLGQGGMGVVYKTMNTKLDRLEALKVINPSFIQNEHFLQRFEQEAKALARIHHPNIVTIYTLENFDAGKYISMEYVEGRTLADVVAEKGALDWSMSKHIIEQLLSAFAYAHKEGVLHRDIKPQNIMLTAAGRVKIMDFGLAKFYLNEDVTQSAFRGGTLSYMSPEQIKGEKLDQRSDIFSLGMTCYEMFTGRLPFEKESGQFQVQRIIVEEAFLPPHHYNRAIPEGLSKIIIKALEKSPADRYRSASSMLDAFRSFYKRAEAASPVSDSSVYTGSRQAEKPTRKGRRLKWTPLALLLAAGLVWGSIAWGPKISDMLFAASNLEPPAQLEDNEKEMPGRTERLVTEAPPNTTTGGIPSPPAEEDSVVAGADFDPPSLQNKLSGQKADSTLQALAEEIVQIPPTQIAVDPSNKADDSQTTSSQPKNETVEAASTNPAGGDEDKTDSVAASPDSLLDAPSSDITRADSLQPGLEIDEPADEAEKPASVIMSMETSVRTEMEVMGEMLKEAIMTDDWIGLETPVTSYYRSKIDGLKKFIVLDAEVMIDEGSTRFGEMNGNVGVILRIGYRQKGSDLLLPPLDIPAIWDWKKTNEWVSLTGVRGV